MQGPTNPLVHLELHTGNLPRACAFYGELFGWRTERVDFPCGSYHALGVGNGIEGGVVEHDAQRSVWLPYVRVADIERHTARALELGADVVVAPREGPMGWRSVVTTPAGSEIALWQSKRHGDG